jgi:hypothetical protein
MSHEIETLTRVVAGLPPDAIRQVIDFALFLQARHAAPVDYSDEWTDEDLRDATLASLRRFEAEHPDEDWGTDYTGQGGTGCSPPAT